MDRPPGGPGEGGKLGGGGLAGQRITLHQKKFHFLRIEGDEYIISLDPPPPTPSLGPIELLPIEP